VEDDASAIRADDHDAVKAAYMPQLPDLDSIDETVFTWDIDNWKGLNKREHSPVFHCAGFPWKILFFPFGNNVDHASFYLEHGYEEKPEEDWYACAQFTLVLWNPNDPRILQQHTATHRFTHDEGDWGFTRFAELRKLMNQPWDRYDRPMIENNSAKLTAYIRVVNDPTGVLWHSFVNYDSKKETGMVGLKNQGATCYLNSLLQSLYFTTAFRKAVYQIPTDVEEPPRSNSAYALQRLFLQLQTSNNAVATNELTASFGWDSRQIFEQQDVQELSRVLMERLEEKMKGTEAENALGKMFVGRMKTYISCINVDFQSSRIEEFWDVQLNVSKMAGIDDSFRDYCLPEIMDGENKYMAEGFGLQDAKKGVIFESFPSVLHLQLKRFEYDFQRDSMMKINDRYEFPETWDASPYLSEDADRSEPYIYKLHGVLVHSGDLNAGHYYAFLKPTKDGHFYKFDDDRVTRATLKEAIDENFGGEYPNGLNGQATARISGAKPPKRSMNAYMLVYIRECHSDRILLTGEVVEPPDPVAAKYAEERALLEKKKKDKEEAHLYTDVVVATDKNFKAHQGFDIVHFSNFDNLEPDAVPKVYRVLRTTPVNDFVKTVADEMGLSPDLLRPWSMVNRQNGTIRPDQYIVRGELNLEEAANKYGTKNSGLRMWIEVAEDKDKDGKPVWGESAVDFHGRQGDRPIVLFLKYFDVENQSLFGMGHFYAAQQDKVADLSPQILELLKWPAGTPLKLYEVRGRDSAIPWAVLTLPPGNQAQHD
jgi:ubiquitin carboxyl-terminal hydrolase 7